MARFKKSPYRLLRNIVTIFIVATILLGVTYGSQDTAQLTNEFNGKYDATVSVKKVWQPANGHPDSVKVQLYRNGIPQGTPVTLDESNNWMYKWTGLSVNDVWTVDEVEVPAGYIVAITGTALDGFVVTNSKKPPEKPDPPEKPNPPDPPKPPVPPEPKKDNPDTDVPAVVKDPDDPNSNIHDPNLPQGGKDPDPNIPKTGDDADPRLWLVILALSTFLLRRELFFRNNKSKPYHK
jgi:hypothetical protein